jgi:hypothetical protein
MIWPMQPGDAGRGKYLAVLWHGQAVQAMVWPDFDGDFRAKQELKLQVPLLAEQRRTAKIGSKLRRNCDDEPA